MLHRIRKTGQVGHPRPFMSWARDYLQDNDFSVSDVELSEKPGAFPGVVYVTGDVWGVRDNRRLKILSLVVAILIFPITILWFVLAAKSLSRFVIATDRLAIRVNLEGEMYTGAAAKEQGMNLADDATSEVSSRAGLSGGVGIQSADRVTVVSDIRVSVTGQSGEPNGKYRVKSDNSRSQEQAKEYVGQIDTAMETQWPSLTNAMSGDE